MTIKCVLEKPYKINECTKIKYNKCMSSFIRVHYVIRWRLFYMVLNLTYRFK